ncbi:PD-(D/E)XK nuclease-like domain-containing protein [Pantoea agglomerans]|uniref:PD-(D/E)XK nuclease-like domain-containing protein n=1 Tax=Enterobacter agglomerans TaxID=549 RepID=A0ACC5PUX4_ENTAG|nr:PD-(D/E)XK nuclease-like domain-containing protein [Pantoea agglomerans]MBD8129056.1 PD-(D/E)XK nuclease-like domain-containing protein [Pantoea agglomerans]MBD8153779.1 PD-(D/E)XK nuclease-like domain-containing protein [Pantoea agglomerans]MBD8157774.1 PD-(D/E)XK nuclease-like domain-containing protein [Pantoea agglomerans]MBD8231612.1 PD-(D/E)XK nuclease-like domain-containing protein [Pantoea agglomerans]MBD8241694.1 PD-(D/E)XK nuclease-like domain-containing protein [Pantoea agglomeran
MQTFSIYLHPEDPSSGLPEYATCLEERAAWIAKSKALSMLEALTPDTVHQYAEPLAGEDRPGLPRPPMNVLSTDFLKKYLWDEENNVFTERPQADSKPVNFDALSSEQKMAVLVRHGTPDVDSMQLKDALHLLNDERDTAEGGITESLYRTPGVAAMYPETVLELISELGNHFDGADNWQMMKAFNEKWLKDRQAARKDSDDKATTLRTASGAKAGGGKPTDRGTGHQHDFDSLRREIALGLHARAADFNIYDLRSAQINRAREIIRLKEKPFPAWEKLLLATPGILDYSRAMIIYTVKTAPDNIHLTPGALQAYINKTLTETDHANPDPEIVAIACGRQQAQKGEQHNETQQNPTGEEHVLADAAQPAGTVESHTDKPDGAASGMASVPPVTERAGPFYARNEAGEVKRANKEKGLHDLLSQGYTEISKDEYQNLKNAPAVEPNLRENAESSTESLRENADPSTSTTHEEQLAASINGVQIVETAPGKFSIKAFLAPDASPEGEKAEAVTPEPAETSAPAPAFPAVFDYGRYEGIPNNVYHSANGISSSMVKDARISLMYYHGRHITGTIPRDTSDALTLGALVHTLALEPGNFDKEFSAPFSLPADSISTTAEMKAIIEQHNATLAPAISTDEIKAMLEAHNQQLPKPFTMGSSAEETGFLYSSLPEAFRRIPEGEKHTGTAMKACIREYNASLLAPLKTAGSRDSLLSELEKIAPEKAAEERAKPQPFGTSGSKDELAAIVRQIAPDTVFADELRAQWEKENSGKTLITAEQYSLATAIQSALLSHPVASGWLQHPQRRTEVSYFGIDDDTGLDVRVRPDLEIDDGRERLAFDVKTVSLPRVKQDNLRYRLHREIMERDYHLSAAMYCDVAMFDRFFWIFVNKEPGYHWVAVVEASEDELALGRAEYRHQLAAIRRAMDTGIWPAPVTESIYDTLTSHEYDRLKAMMENGAAS